MRALRRTHHQLFRLARPPSISSLSGAHRGAHTTTLTAAATTATPPPHIDTDAHSSEKPSASHTLPEYEEQGVRSGTAPPLHIGHGSSEERVAWLW